MESFISLIFLTIYKFLEETEIYINAKVRNSLSYAKKYSKA
jgi:hypothetical protein